jgi:hypothetical protein
MQHPGRTLDPEDRGVPEAGDLEFGAKVLRVSLVLIAVKTREIAATRTPSTVMMSSISMAIVFATASMAAML